MQIHLDSPCFTAFGVPHLYTTRPGSPFATLPIGQLELLIESEDEADQLIARACEVKDMFRLHKAERETSEPVAPVQICDWRHPGSAARCERTAGHSGGHWARADVTAQDDAGRAIAADLDWERAQMCGAARIGFGPCVHKSFHGGWHMGAEGAGWPQYDVDTDLDAALTGPGYQLPAAEVTR